MNLLHPLGLCMEIIVDVSGKTVSIRRTPRWRCLPDILKPKLGDSITVRLGHSALLSMLFRQVDDRLRPEGLRKAAFREIFSITQ